MRESGVSGKEVSYASGRASQVPLKRLKRYGRDGRWVARGVGEYPQEIDDALGPAEIIPE